MYVPGSAQGSSNVKKHSEEKVLRSKGNISHPILHLN